jgi:hypothetical protein
LLASFPILAMWPSEEVVVSRGIILVG